MERQRAKRTTRGRRRTRQKPLWFRCPVRIPGPCPRCFPKAKVVRSNRIGSAKAKTAKRHTTANSFRRPLGAAQLTAHTRYAIRDGVRRHRTKKDAGRGNKPATARRYRQRSACRGLHHAEAV